MGDHARLLRGFTRLPGPPAVLVPCHPIKNADPNNLVPRGGGAFVNEVDGNAALIKNGPVVTLTWHVKFRGPVAFELMTVTSDKLVTKRGKKMPTINVRCMTEDDRKQADAETMDEENELLIALLESDGKSMSQIAEGLGWFD